MWTLPEANEIARPNGNGDEGNTLVAAECGPKKVVYFLPFLVSLILFNALLVQFIT
jgi:hypothetical protein